LQLEEVIPATLEGEAIRVHGIIRQIPDRSGPAHRFTLEDVRRAGGSGWPNGDATLTLTTHHALPALYAGSTCQLYVRLQRPRGTRSDGAFDFERWAHATGLDATGYVVAHRGNVCARKAGFSLGALRENLAAQIFKAVSAPQSASILAALAVGARTEIDPGQWLVLRDTGVIHLLSVSGLHVAMVALSLFWFATRGVTLVSRLKKRPLSGWVACVIALGGAASYALLAGFTVPTQRTLVMIAVLMLDGQRVRGFGPADALLFAAAALLTCDPLASLTLSFWLSFIAIALLMLRDELGIGRGPVSRWAGVHLHLAMLLTPLLAVTFGTVPLMSPLANFIAVPAVSYGVVPMVLGGVALASVAPEAATTCWQAAAMLWEWVWQILEILAGMVPATRFPFVLDAARAGLLFVGVLSLFQPVRALRVTTIALSLLICAVPLRERPAYGEFSLTVLDVGQGLAVAVETADQVLIYDTGTRFRTGGDFAASVVLPWLARRGWRALDALVVSHSDLDHSGGVETLRSGLRVRSAFAGQPVATGPGFRQCSAGQHWSWADVYFTFLHPGTRTEAADDNDKSCVLYIRSASGSALVPGDITQRVEHQLLAQRRVPHADTLVLAHHGSKSSSSQSFIDAVAPSHALVSAGYRNRFGHPHPELIAALRKRDIRVLQTMELGTITLAYRRGGLVVDGERAFRRYWDTPLPEP
jgi:competence protein ComEC